LPIGLRITDGSISLNAEDRSNGDRVFCGYCRDMVGSGSLCFEGDTDTRCPVAIPPADGKSVSCTSDADCADGDEYESCVQRDPGAFSQPAATRISVGGSTADNCLADGRPHQADLVSIFCIPPVFNSGMDGPGDLPGPGVVSLEGEVQLQ
jgi:hypothetical protein